MSDQIAVTGLVGTEPRALTTSSGLALTSFRLASTHRRFDRTAQEWVDVDTNWYTVVTFRNLAVNAATSIRKGQRVVVSGRLRIRDWEKEERSGKTIEIEAESLGHDLAWGTSTFARTVGVSPPTRDAPAPAELAGGTDGPESTERQIDGAQPEQRALVGAEPPF